MTVSLSGFYDESADGFHPVLLFATVVIAHDAGGRWCSHMPGMSGQLMEKDLFFQSPSRHGRTAPRIVCNIAHVTPWSRSIFAFSPHMRRMSRQITQ
ncbi:hypothetical protein K6L44_03625 [Gluconacetobacter entanii]|uniref:hypothetical protein n=1 Tax=Gluconacetobacter entanii TaxID=108528 RepID=UPI001C9358E8|nr:hypothetical protein [Gluconacetobacter entanii]MBY4639107.1 hypothetical protein [Gluconacetobacter entanii]MCW4585388.1 hypothetical protein [Gluconacetobacter entanii]